MAQHVDLAVVEHFAGMPYIGAHQEFMNHMRICETCGEAFDSEAQCYEFCSKGHALVHKAEAVIAMTASASVWN